MNNINKRLSVVYIYKDFDDYNGLIEQFLMFSKYKAKIPFDFEVWVFRNKKTDYSKIYINNGARLVNLGFDWGSNPLIILKLIRLLKQKCPDVVQTFILKPNIYGIIAAAAAKIPVIISTELTHMDQAPTIIKRIRDKVLYRIYKYLTKLCDQVVCVSNSIKNELLRLKIFCGIKVISPPIDISKIKPNLGGNKEMITDDNKEVVIGIVARLSEEKGHSELIDAFSSLAKLYRFIKLIIVGEGPLHNILEKQTRIMGIEDKVIFTGFQIDIDKYLNNMDIFVLPSRTEGLPVAILEAMAKGLPVIATRTGGITELVEDHKTGILVDYKRVDQLVSALSYLIDNEDKRLEYGLRGMEKIKNKFGFGKYVEEIYDLYISLYKIKKIKYGY